VTPQLTEFEQARTLVLEAARPLETESVELDAALDRVLAEEVVASEDVPPFDNSAMDGFAVRAADTGPGVRLAVVDRSRAGAPASLALGAGEACAISTGAVMPAGADAVVAVEDTDAREGEVELAVGVERGRFVRRAGDDIRAGQRLLEPGVRFGPAELGVLAAAGCPRVTVGRRPVVAILTTGDELAGLEEDLAAGAVRNSTALVLPALVQRAGGCVAGVAHARDDPSLIRDAVAHALAADVVVISGGMSVGEHDHVAAVLASLGVQRSFAGIALRPGKPFWFGTHGATLVFGLPGNPVSSFVTFLLLVRPALIAMAGESPRRTRTLATLDAEREQAPGRLDAVRCRLELRPDGWHASATGTQGSHVLTSMLGADALALIPPGTGTLAAGTQVSVELI
jgi:molybdopterin molybdotransferase